MTVPTEGYPEWATDSIVDPVSGTANKAPPSSKKKQYGQAYGQSTTRQDINYQFDLIRQWIQAFDEQNEAGSMYVTSDMLKTVGDVSDQFGGTWVDDGDQVFGTVASSGYQDVSLDPTVEGTDSTGLLNDATTYTMTVTIDGGGGTAVSVVGSASQTWTDLITEINTDISGSATASIYKGRLRITSDTTGAASTISIADTDLLSSLTQSTTIETAIDGDTGTTCQVFRRTA